MRAVVCHALGGPEGLAVEEVAPPALGAGAVRLRVHAAGVNFADSLMIAGRYQDRRRPPFVPGLECAGVVVETAPGVETCRPGDRVLAVVDGGGYAEEAVARAEDVFVLPEGTDLATAAGFAIAYGTAHYGLTRRAGLRAGETVLVTGAAGGAGLTAVEVAARLGAEVIACAGGADKLAVAAGAGARHGIDYRAEDIRARAKELTGGRGVEVVYDTVGGDAGEAALKATAPGARLLLVGFAAGRAPHLRPDYLLVKNIAVHGYYWGAYRRLDPAGLRASVLELLAWQADGRLAPHVSAVLPLERAAEALALLRERKSTGKVVLAVAP